MNWVRYCEAHPEDWAAPRKIEIPLGPLDMTFDEVQELFERPTLTEVRQAVEDWCADDEAGNQPWGAYDDRPIPSEGG